MLMIEILAMIENMAIIEGMNTPKHALERAIAKAGGLEQFAEKVGAPSEHAVKAWKINRVPSDYCPKIERITGVRCESLRPDVEWKVLRRSARAAKLVG
jgi:DNA-binding transcriptional regulator YdaS (Cro superfamily)